MKSPSSIFRPLLFTIAFILAGLNCVYAQTSISGTVTDPIDKPLSDVSVLVKGTAVSTNTDAQGRFALNVPANAILVFSRVGFAPQELAVNNQTSINLKMVASGESLGEVVVTALGIKKEKKAVGFAVQEVKGEALQKAISPNVMESLTGKVAGLTITNSADFFSDPGLFLRGKRPLIVIDGVPNPNTDMWNISSDDIENVSVLKGSAASALYGSLGLNGAIQITLKSGSNIAKGTSVSFNSSTTFQGGFIRIPKIQTQYGPGEAGVYEFGTGASGGGGKNDFDYSIWGPKFDGRLLPQYDSPIDPVTGKRIPTPWVSRGANNLGNFMETGLVSSNNISVQTRGDKGAFTISNTYKYSKASIPGAKLKINTLRLTGQTKFSEQLSLEASLQHTYEFASNVPRNNYGPHSPIYTLAIWGGAHFDIRDMRNYWVPGKEGLKQNFVENWRYNNPYMMAYEWRKPYTKNDVLGFLKLNYKITKNLDAFIRSNLSTYSLTDDDEISVDIYDYVIEDRGGRYRHFESKLLESNTDFLLSYQNSFYEDNLSVKVTLGGNQRYYKYDNVSASTTRLVVPGIYKLSNSVDRVTPTSYKESKGVYSGYSSLDLAYKNQIFLGLTGRVDKSSTLTEKNSAFFYPSVSLSVIVSDMIRMPVFIDYLKLRGAYAKVGGDMDIYTAVNSYTTGNRYRNLPTASYPATLDNPDLKPEFNSSYEYGIEARLFNNRLGFDFSYYTNKYGPQIFTQRFSQTSGYTGIRLNGRTTERKGFDFSVNAVPVKWKHFTWSTLINVDAGREYLTSLPPLPDGTPQLAEGRTKIGDRLGNYWYYQWERSPDGELIINANGLPRRTDFQKNQGNTQPDFILAINNNLTYKNFSLSFLVDGRFGGITYDRYERDLWRSGSHPDAIHPERELSNIAYATGGDPKTMLIPGVKIVSGEVTYDPDGNILSDSRKFAPSDYKVTYQAWASSYKAAWESQLIEKTFIKLREVVLTYTLPSTLLGKSFVKGASFSLVGRNLLYWTKDKDTFGDLDTYTMSTGDTELQQPSQRTYGFNINLNF
jgi:TonB-linked SusC/RagA family outer membrane protein